MSKITQIAELLNQDNNLYFTIEYYNEDYEPTRLAHLSEDNKGSEKFLEYVNKAHKYGAKDLLVKLYRKGKKDFRKTPEVKYMIPLDREKSLQGLQETTLAGFKPYGGLEGFISQKVELETLRSEINRLREEKTKIETELTIKSKENEALKRKRDELEAKIKELEWTIRDMERTHKYEIEDIRRKNSNLERIIELAGVSVAKGLGLNKEDLMGLLGVDNQLMPNTEDKPANSEVDVDIEVEDNEKEQAFQYLKQITQIMKYNIEQNTPEDAQAYAWSLWNVFSYMHTSKEQFQNIIAYIEQQNTFEEKKTEVETEIIN